MVESDADAKTRGYWNAHTHDAEDVTETSFFSQFGPEHFARLDCIYVPHLLVPLQIFRVSSSVCSGFREFNDHIPVSLAFQVKSKSNRNANHIPT